MGQNSSHPQQSHPVTPYSNFSTTCESVSGYTDGSSFTFHNIPVIEGIPVRTIPSTYKYTPDNRPVYYQSLTTTTTPSSSPSSSVTYRTTATYQLTDQLLHEARQQYFSGHGLFYSLATHKLRPHWLHPVDLTESEFLSFAYADNSDAWIASRCAKLLHRAISRRQQAQRELKDAGIPYWQLQGMEMFELMSGEERGRFIAEFKRQQKDIADELLEEMEEEIGSGSDFGPARRQSESVDTEDMKMRELERARSMETRLSQWSSEETNKALRRHHSLFGSLGEVFRNHRRKESDGSSEESYPDPRMSLSRKPRRLSKSWRRSVHSLRHVFRHKHRAFKRAEIGELVFAE